MTVKISHRTYLFKNCAKSGNDVLAKQRRVRSVDVLDNAINEIKYWQLYLNTNLYTEKTDTLKADDPLSLFVQL